MPIVPLQLRRFFFVGLVNTALDFAIFAMFYFVFGTGAIVANAVGYAVAVANSYCLNKYWTFSESRDRNPTVAIWLLASLVPPLYAKGCVAGLTFLWNYWSSRRFVYRQDQGKAPSGV